MTTLRNWWMVVLLGAVLMATLVGVAAARPNDRPTAALSRRISIPAGHFYPHDDNDLYFNAGEFINSNTTALYEYFYAPVVFPTGQSVVVESVTLYAYDNNDSREICVRLFLTDMTAGSEVVMAYVCSTGDSATDPRSFTDTSIDNNPAKHGKGVYLELAIEDDSNLKAYGVRIQYHHGTT